MEHPYPDPDKLDNWEKTNEEIDKAEQKKLGEFEKNNIKRTDQTWKDAETAFTERRENQVDAYFDILLEPFKIEESLSDGGNEKQIQTIKNFMTLKFEDLKLDQNEFKKKFGLDGMGLDHPFWKNLEKLNAQVTKYETDYLSGKKLSGLVQSLAAPYIDGTTVLDPRTSTWKKFRQYMSKKSGGRIPELPKNAFPELIKSALEYLDPDTGGETGGNQEYKGMSKIYTEKLPEMMKNMVDASVSKIINTARLSLDNLRNKLQELNGKNDISELNRYQKEILDKLEKTEGSQKRPWYELILIFLGMFGSIYTVVKLATCQAAEQRSGCFVYQSDQVSDVNADGIAVDSPEKCKYGCGTDGKKDECVNCCGGCGLLGAFGLTPPTDNFASYCCSANTDPYNKGKPADQQRSSATGWTYKYFCADPLSTIGDGMKAAAGDLGQVLADFFKKLGPYLPYIIGIIIAIILVPMMINIFKK
jgi:hypothetical protein